MITPAVLTLSDPPGRCCSVKRCNLRFQSLHSYAAQHRPCGRDGFAVTEKRGVIHGYDGSRRMYDKPARRLRRGAAFGIGTFCRCGRSETFCRSKPYPRRNQYGKTPMSKKAGEHHKQSAEHHTHAARHHNEAAKHHESGQHEKAAHHAHVARGHALHARHHSDEAAKAHMDEHGKK